MKIKVNGVVIDTEGKDEGAVNAEIQAAYDKGIEGLTNKNTELLGEVKDLKTKMKEAKTIEEYTALETKLAGVESELTQIKKDGTGDYKGLYEKAQADHKAEIEKKDATINSLQSNLDNTIVSNEISKALSANNVNPVLADSATQLLSGEVTVIEENGKKVARVGDKSVDDYVKEWAGTDVGKNFVMAGNQGGGGNGGHKPGQSGVDPATYFDPNHENYSVTEQSKIYNEDAALHDTLSKKFAPQQAV